MRLIACMFTMVALSACQSHNISENAQALSNLEQERARLNRVYAQAESDVLQNQRSDAAYAAAKIHLHTLRQLRFKLCDKPKSPAISQRLPFVQCQFAALNKDYEQLRHWQQSRYQFPPRVALPASMQSGNTKKP